MDPYYYGLIEMLLVFGLVVGFGLYQLWSVRRDIRRAKERAGQSPDAGAT